MMGLTRVRFTPLRKMVTATALALELSTFSAGADDRSKPEADPVDAKPSVQHNGPTPTETVAERFKVIRDEYEAVQEVASQASEEAKTDFEGWKAYSERKPDEAAFSKRMVDLAVTDPDDPAARDALLWVLDKPGMGPSGPYGDEFTRAVLLLLRHHADDPEVARLGLQLGNLFSAARDLFLEGVYSRAEGRDAKGLARMALGDYLGAKAVYAATVRKGAEAGQLEDVMRIQTYDESGKLVEKEIPMPPEDLAYRLHLRLCDPDSLQAESKRLLEEVIDDYGNIPFVTRRYIELEAMLKEPSPTWGGEPLSAKDRKQIERMLARKKTLAEAAKDRLDERENLVVGKPAPPIDGTGMDGRPLRLSDYRGKVVVLVFWGTWCGPCMGEVPHEREMAERYAGKPFVLLGVDCDGDKDAALKVMRREGITWPNWNDGEPGEGPIVKSYHVRGFPTTYVLDGHGTIRHIGLVGTGLDEAIDELLDAMPKDGTPE